MIRATFDVRVTTQTRTDVKLLRARSTEQAHAPFFLAAEALYGDSRGRFRIDNENRWSERAAKAVHAKQTDGSLTNDFRFRPSEKNSTADRTGSARIVK